MRFNEIIQKMKSLSTTKTKNGMERFGINTQKAFGISVYDLQRIARETGKDHTVAQQLWATGIHEARILASMVDEPELVTDSQMESWVREFDSWDVCDQCCSNLFDKTRFAYQKAEVWSRRQEEFVKRAGFVMMACLAVHDKAATDDDFLDFMPIIKRESTDNRNFVKKAVNWALRQIGKRNVNLNKTAIITAREIQTIDSKSARWIAADALRELTGAAVQRRLNRVK